MSSSASAIAYVEALVCESRRLLPLRHIALLPICDDWDEYAGEALTSLIARMLVPRMNIINSWTGSSTAVVVIRARQKVLAHG